MNLDKLFEMAMYTIPSLITGGIAYYLFDMHFKDQQNTRRWLLQKENQKHALPLKLQAYERLALFLERINPNKLLIRVAPIGDDKNDYQNLIIQHIEQEFEHNMTQQIYVSNECWTMILTAKNTIIQNIRLVAAENSNVNTFREKVLSGQLSKESASQLALSYLKNEISQFM